jgi:hypothetical protein
LLSAELSLAYLFNILRGADNVILSLVKPTSSVKKGRNKGKEERKEGSAHC